MCILDVIKASELPIKSIKSEENVCHVNTVKQYEPGHTVILATT